MEHDAEEGSGRDALSEEDEWQGVPLSEKNLRG